MSLAEALEEGARTLAPAGFERPHDEAARIWARMEGTTVGDTWLRRSEPAGPDERARFLEAVARRADGEPAAYATGVGAFRTLDLLIDSRVLIPRPETEGLVDHVLAWGGERGVEDWGTALDLGTGSGCLALALAVEGRFRRVVATDASAAALTVADANAERVAPPVPVELRQGSLFQPVAEATFDVIVSNPPYLTEAEFAALDPAVRDHEPRDALVGGADGMDHIRGIAQAAGARLAPRGLLALEVDCNRAEAAAELARRAGWDPVRLERDLFGRLRYLLATKESDT